MVRSVVGLFFVAHGLIHLAMSITPFKRASAPFNPSRSWLLSSLGLGDGPVRSVALVLALVAGIGFLIAGAGWLGAQGWGRTLAVWSAAVSLFLVVVYFHPWLSFAVLIDAAILYLLLR